LKANLDEKVKDVENQFSEDLDNLMHEGAQLRFVIYSIKLQIEK
jgi:hypothetical protein